MTAGLDWALAEFDRCAPWIEAALDRAGGTWTLAEVRDLLAEERLQIWPTRSSVMVTKINDYQNGKRIMSIWLGGGNLKEIQQNVPRLEEWAKSAGCTSISITGRRGWLRALAGYRDTKTAYLMKEL